jgi:acetylornithine/LysW-gamma-L-lysine aminotransferase
MGLTLAKPEIIECMKIGEHSSTFAGNPLACAAGIATIEALTDDKLVENAAKTGKFFKEGLLNLKEKHKVIREIRGMGMMLAIESRFDIKELLFDGVRNGLLMLYSGRNVIRLLPPLVMDEKTTSQALQIMDHIFTKEERRRNVD